MVAKRRWLSWLIIIIIISVVLRVGLSLVLGNEIEDLRGGTFDQISYDSLALRVADGHGFTFAEAWWPATGAGEPTAHWSFLYVLSLTSLYKLFGHLPILARIIQAFIVGILTPLFIYRIGRRTFNRTAGLLAAAISAIYAYFIMYGASLMTESLYIVSILWSLDVAMRLAGQISSESTGGSRTGNRRMLFLGVELGLAMAAALLLRQVIMAFFLVMGLWLMWVTWRRSAIRSLAAPFAAAALVLIVSITPVIIRNYLAFDRFTALNTNAGYAFYWSNHPIYGTRFESVLSPSHGVTYQELIPQELAGLDEAALDRALLRRGLEFVRDDPGRYILLSLSRIPVYFLFWPKSDSTLLSNAARLLSFALFLPVMLYGLIMAVRKIWRTAKFYIGRPKAPDKIGESQVYLENVLLLLAFIFVYSFIHIVSWANVRYRLPVDAILIIFAGYGLYDLLLRIQSAGYLPFSIPSSAERASPRGENFS